MMEEDTRSNAEVIRAWRGTKDSIKELQAAKGKLEGELYKRLNVLGAKVLAEDGQQIKRMEEWDYQADLLTPLLESETISYEELTEAPGDTKPAFSPAHEERIWKEAECNGTRLRALRNRSEHDKTVIDGARRPKRRWLKDESTANLGGDIN